MLHPTLLILVPLVGLVSSNLEISDADSFAQYELKIPEYKELTSKLQKTADELRKSFVNYINELAADNDLLHAVKAYRKAYESSTNTNCAGREPPNENGDNDLMMSFINDCTKSSPAGVVAFSGKLALSKAKLKQADFSIHTTCTNNPENCEEEKKIATQQLKSMFTPEFDAELKSDATAALEVFKTSLDECFKHDTTEMLDDLVKGTEALNECSTAK